jgi:hypothetical protein
VVRWDEYLKHVLEGVVERPRGDASEGEWSRVLAYEYVLFSFFSLENGQIGT